MARKTKTKTDQPTIASLDDTALLVLWDEETAKAEKTDSWDHVAEIETEVNKRGLGEAPATTTDAATETPPLQNRSVVPNRWVREYAKRPLKGTCSDQMAYALAEATQTDGKPDRAKIEAVGVLNGIDVQARWGARNIGMQRMNLGNVLRGRIKRGEPVNLQ